MGEVYLAYDTQLRRQVAVKILPAEFTQNKLRLSRFEREAYAASSLNHPNILTIHEIGQQEGHHFIATEYIEGESLRQQMARSRVELREVLDVVQQVASALSAAHQAGIVHRDIKPENIMLRQDGYVKVLDFGLAKLADATVAAKQSEADSEAPTKMRMVHTEPGMVMGTASYMSPEQARGLDVDARTDIWSLGVMLYEMVAGRLPFEGATTTDVLSMILHREPPSLLLYRKDVPAELERIMEKALAKEKEERYQTAKDLSVDVKRLRQRLEVEAELERSITPEEEARRASEGLSVGSSQAAISGTTQAAAAVPTAETSAAHTLSSAEYVIGEIKRHRRGVALMLAAVVIATAFAAFAYYSYFGSRSQAITSIAVLPFTNASGDPNTEYLSDGISESLIDNLSQLPGMKVIARSSTFKYKGKEVDPQEVATALGVRAILSGRVMQRGDQLQVRAELIDARDRTQVWGEQYNRNAADVLQVQSEISREIAETLRVRLTAGEQQQLAKRETANPQAYELLLKGRFYSGKGGSENQKKALEYFQQAIAVDPTYALAYAELSASYSSLVGTSSLDPKEFTPKAEAAVRKALELDESLAEAHLALANIKLNAWDWPNAEREYQRAIELNPNQAEAYSWFSTYHTVRGRHEQAIAEAKRARELDPLSLAVSTDLGFSLLCARQYDQGLEFLKKTLELDQNNSQAHIYLAYLYMAKEMYAEAIGEYQEKIKLDGDSSSAQIYLGAAYAKAGERGKAQEILKRLQTSKEYVSPGELPVLYAALGEREQAFASLEEAYAAHDLQLQYLGVDPALDSLRGDPRFQDLMRRVGLGP
jgi:serine/threonine protein kinase/Tfp pilus assembly protein PilF